MEAEVDDIESQDGGTLPPRSRSNVEPDEDPAADGSALPGNDDGYDEVFSGQLDNFARDDDLLVVISASGNSPNLVRAVEVASGRGTVTIGLLGFDGGVLKDLVSECVWLSTEKIGRAHV